METNGPKPNRAKEIREKQAFQAKFQLALSLSTKHALNWLPGSDLGAEPTGSDFLQLPVIGPGSTLAELEKLTSTLTIADFLSSEMPVKGPKPDRSRDSTAGSQAMHALMNRARTEQRHKISKKGIESKKPHHGRNQPKLNARSHAAEGDLDSDEDSKARHIKSKSAVKKGKPRPF